MATKKNITKKDTKNLTKKVKELDDAIIFKANKPLTKSQFELLSDLIKSEQAKTGKAIILMPNSCDLETS